MRYVCQVVFHDLLFFWLLWHWCCSCLDGWLVVFFILLKLFLVWWFLLKVCWSCPLLWMLWVWVSCPLIVDASWSTSIQRFEECHSWWKQVVNIWSTWCQLWTIVKCPWGHVDCLPKMSFSNPIVWCLVCWVWWWYAMTRAWDVCWWLLWLLACMSCCWSHCRCLFSLLDLCLCLLMLLRDLSWRCCFRLVASWCWCFWLKPCLRSMLILLWSCSDPSSPSVDSHLQWWSLPCLVV